IDRDGAFEQVQFAVGGRVFEVDAAARIEQQLAAVGENVTAALAGLGGGVGREAVQRVVGIADVGSADGAGAQRQRAGEKAAPRVGQRGNRAAKQGVGRGR